MEYHSYDHSFCGCCFLLVLFLLGSRREYTWGHFPNGCHSLCCIALKCLNTAQYVRGLDSCASSYRQCASAMWCTLDPQQADLLVFVNQKGEKWIECKREWPCLGWRGGGSLAWSRYIVSSCNIEFYTFWSTLIVLPTVQIERLIPVENWYLSSCWSVHDLEIFSLSVLSHPVGVCDCHPGFPLETLSFPCAFADLFLSSAAALAGLPHFVSGCMWFLHFA